MKCYSNIRLNTDSMLELEEEDEEAFDEVSIENTLIPDAVPETEEFLLEEELPEEEDTTTEE